MKKIFFLFSFFPLFSFAQDVVPADKNEVGLNLFSVTNFDSYKDPLDKPKYDLNVNAFSGIYYKRYFGKNALRASLDYSQKAFHSEEGALNSTYYSNVSATKKFVSTGIGYQRSFATGKFQPYFFSDLVFNYINFSGHHSFYGDYTWADDQPFSEETFEYGLAAGAGLRYSITPKIHLTYELSGQGVIGVFQDVMYAGKKFVNVDGHFNPVNKVGFAISF
jgi:hypothetical protein